MNSKFLDWACSLCLYFTVVTVDVLRKATV